MLLECPSKSKCTFLGTIFIDQFSRRLFCRLSIDPSSRDSIWSHAIYQCCHPKHCWSSSSLVRWRSSSSPTEHPIATYESMFVMKGRRSREKLRNICPDRRGAVIQGGPDFGHCIQKEAGLGHCVFCAHTGPSIIYRIVYRHSWLHTVCMVVVVARVSDCWELGSYAPSPLAASRPSCTD